MATVGEWLPLARERLAAAGVEAASLEAQMLAAHSLSCDRVSLLAHPERPIPDSAEALLKRREAAEPLAYILGWREFYGRAFAVRPGALIPRQETEILVEQALARLGNGGQVLDLGTGSGCIAATLKLERPACEVWASDISHEALRTAKENFAGFGARVDTVWSDLFSGMPNATFDLIASNPPYIAAHEALPPEVERYEPEIALFAGKTGLEFYERLASEAASHLKPGGSLIVEVGYRQAQDVRAIFESKGWVFGSSAQDLAGIERVLTFLV